MMKTKKILALLISGVFATTMASQAAVITMPSGLSHGDQYRIVFVTSTTIAATSSDISTYNAHVTAAAALNPDLAVIEGTVEQTTTWTAIGSTDSVNALTNTSTTGTGVPIYLLNGDLFAADYTTLWDNGATLKPSLNITEQGEVGGTSLVWAGTNGDGSTGSLALGDPTGETRAGKSDVTALQNQVWWITRINQTNTNTFSLYAMSGILTVPEPSSTALLGLGGLALMLRRKRSR
jgi:hypothetical protein